MFLINGISSVWNFANFNPIVGTAIHLIDFATTVNGFLNADQENKVTLKEEKNRISKHAAVDKCVEKKIHDIAEQCGIIPDQLEVRLAEKGDGYSAVGSLKLFEKGLILIPEDAHARLIETESCVPNEDLFCILHEIGHLLNDDAGKGWLERTKIKQICSLACYTLFFSEYAYEGFGSINSMIGAFIATRVVTSSLVIPAIDFSFMRPCEIAADLFAARFSDEAKQGGLSYFQKTLNENKGWRGSIINPINLIVDEHGNNRFDFAHPPLTERLKLLKQL